MTAYLVGAGPGDPGLLTVRAQQLVARADVILYDLLIGPEILAGARPDAELIFVGKQGGGEQVPQEETNRLLVEHAAAGKDVVRLKGGDPFVFGRGSEEAQVLREAGVDLSGVGHVAINRNPGAALRRKIAYTLAKRPSPRLVLAEGLAGEKRHDQVDDPVRRLAEAENGADVGMIEPHGDGRLATQPLDRGRIP